MSEERRKQFDECYKKFDKDNSGHLSYEEIDKFITQYNKKELPPKKKDFFFHGIDVDNSGYISKEELWELVEALQTNNKLKINKIFFRAIDRNRNNEIDADEFIKMAELNDIFLTEEDAENQIQRLTKGSNVLNFAQMHKALTGDEIPENTDPYDGKGKGTKTRNVNSNNEGGLTGEEKNSIRKLFDKHDKSGNGKLEFDEFLQFMKEALNTGEVSPSFVKQMKFIYDGMDLDGSNNIDESEIMECFEKIKARDFKYQTRMIFRGADRNHNRKVTIDELKLAVENLGDKSFNEESFDVACKTEFGSKKKELEYWEFYKIITGETLDKNSPDYDPYEGQLKQKSKCCLLI